MQNFTLRFKGKPFYLFILTILIGNLPSIYGQSCPTVSDTDQEFCYLSTVSDLEAEAANGSTLRWYRTATSTTPIPSDEFLRDGDYYAGNQDGSCDSRPVVTVTVDDLGAPVSQFGNFYEPCEYSEEDVTTVAELKDLITPSDPSYDINVYEEEYGDESSELADDFILEEGASYFVGQDDPSSDCRYSSRIAIQYNPVDAFAPTAEPNQQFCESDNPTVADLTATATSPNTQAFRWYSTSNSNPALDPSTPLVDGETYYVSQIVNRTNSTLPPCESTERAMVTVEVTPSDAGEDNTDNVLCISEADSELNNTTNARDYFISLLEAGVPTDGSFADESIAEIVADYNDGTKTGTYQTTYTATFDEGCQDSVVLAVRVEADPNPGTDANETVCVAELEPYLPLNPSLAPAAETYIKDFIDDSGIDPNGTFSPSIQELFDTINEDAINGNFPQTYQVTYTVDNNGCEASSTLQLTIEDNPDAGSSNSETLCENEVEDRGIFSSEENLRAYYVDLLGAEDNDGSFNPDLATLIANYNDGVNSPSEDFTTEYTVSGTVCAPASATASLTVNKAIPAEAGTAETDIQYCSDESAIILADLLTGEDSNGLFTSDNADVSDGTFDPSSEGAGTYNITYTVSPETGCFSTTATETFTITVNQAPNAGPGGNFEFCVAEFEAIAAAISSNPAGEGIELLNEIDPTITPGGSFTDDSLEDLLNDYSATTTFPATFSTTYTVNNADCTASSDYTLTITPNEEANAGGDQTVNYCVDAGTVDLTNAIDSGAQTGGTFTSDDLTITGNSFDTTESGTGNFKVTYTVNSDTDPCITGSSFATITVIVDDIYEFPESASDIVCTNDISDDFFTETNLESTFLSLLPGDAPRDGEFNPTIADLSDDYDSGKTTGDFITTYTITSGACEESIELTLTVRESIDAQLEEVDSPDPICQNAGVVDLTDFIGNNPTFGVFEGYEDGTFNPAMMAAGDYEITYTLSEESSECVNGSASITFTITILDSALAGEDNEIDVCTNSGIQDLYTLLSDNADDNGTFTLNDSEITDGMMNPSDFSAGTYTVIYTVPAENECGDDTAEFTITVNESPDAGEGDNLEVCQNAEVQNLFSLLSDGVSTEGSFSINGETITDGMMDPSDFDPETYEVVYTLSNDNCTDTATFEITIKDSANAGADMEIEVCTNNGVQNLFDFLSADADLNGEFTLEGALIVDGLMNPADFAAGEYEVIYTVAAINDCGDDQASIEITVVEAPDAPEVNSNISFCAILNPVGADLLDNNDDLSFYSDAELSMMVTAEEPLVSGTYYVTQRNAGCESDAASFEVTINDPGTPTIDDANPSFCEYDDATIADLNDAVDQTSNVTWYATAEGTEPLSTGTSLQDGVTYYASLYDPETDCDSSDRLAVTVTIEECPLLFPEGISPNGDGLNDVFDIENIEREYPNYTLEIYNRWGDMVYKGNAATPDWDGSSNQSGALGDDVLPVGVYFYLIEFNDGQTAPRRGKVYLSR